MFLNQKTGLRFFRQEADSSPDAQGSASCNSISARPAVLSSERCPVSKIDAWLGHSCILLQTFDDFRRGQLHIFTGLLFAVYAVQRHLRPSRQSFEAIGCPISRAADSAQFRRESQRPDNSPVVREHCEFTLLRHHNQVELRPSTRSVNRSDELACV